MIMRIQKISQLNSKSRFLQKYQGNNVTTQRGEDGIIKAVFDIIGTENKFCIEFFGLLGMANFTATHGT